MYTRRAKESHRDTISYEIDMLAFCNDKLARLNGVREGDGAIALEAYLLHYRNLIRVFGGKYHQADDISTFNGQLWAGRELNPTEIAAIQNPAKTLDDAYFKVISKYLQHCTALRYEHDRSWDVALMTMQIAPVIESFEKSFPR